MSETGSPVQIDRTDTGHTGNNGQDGFGLSENGDVITTTTTTTSSGQNQYRHKMRPPSQAAFQRVKNCYPKMSKKEKRFDPSKAIIPRLMPDEPMTIAINPNLPHQPLDYFQGMKNSNPNENFQLKKVFQSRKISNSKKN